MTKLQAPTAPPRSTISASRLLRLRPLPALLALAALPGAAQGSPAVEHPARPEARFIVALDGQCIDLSTEGPAVVLERVERSRQRDIHTWVVEVPVSTVEIDVTFDGAEVALAADGARVRRDGQSWAYSQLHAFDAAGRSLPMTWSVEDGGLRLRVDTRGATFPVLVDPVYADYSSYVFGGHVYSFATPDFDGDGRQDFFLLDNGLEYAKVDTGSGPSEIPYIDGAGQYDDTLVDRAQVGDFDGDGSDEVVVPLLVDGGVRPLTVLFDDLEEPRLLTAIGDCGDEPRRADLNGDGLDDLIRFDVCSGDVVINLGSASGLQDNSPLMSGSDSWRPSGVGDLNGDGLADVMGADLDLDVMQYRPGRTDGTLDSPVDIAAPDCFGFDTIAVDPDADGDMDVVQICQGSFEVWENDGLGGFAKTFEDYVSDADYYVFDVGDVDADGYPDVASGGCSGAVDEGEVAFYRGGPSGLTEAGRTILEGPSELFGFSVMNGGDSDGDGYGELVVGAANIAFRYGGYVDEDGDGVKHLDDCDDFEADAYPGNVEVVGNGIDEDCDGTSACWADGDGDGYASEGAAVVQSVADCSGVGEAKSRGSYDCDDSDADRYPRAPETPDDGIDQDCDDQEDCYTDADADGFRWDEHTVSSTDLDCLDAGEATADFPDGDCDDGDSTAYPGAPETEGDGVDQDCDGADAEPEPTEPEPTEAPDPPEPEVEETGCSAAPEGGKAAAGLTLALALALRRRRATRQRGIQPVRPS